MNIPRAAKVLDKLIPGWFRLVDPAKLKMHDCSQCVCGQIARHAVGGRWTKANSRRYVGDGFGTPYEAFLKEAKKELPRREFDTLSRATEGIASNVEWRAEIRKRLEVAA